MRILTVRQPRAWAIIHGGKNVENRVRNIAGGYRCPVAIHAAIGKTADLNERQERLLLAADEEGLGGIGDWLDGEPVAGGEILGVVDLVEMHRSEGTAEGIVWDMIRDRNPYSLNGACSPWAEANAYHLVLANPRPLSEPIRYRGALGLRNPRRGNGGADRTATRMTPGHVFPARYDGVCAANCGNRIHPGDPVRYDDRDQLRHDACTPKRDPLDLREREVVCPDCWVVKPCRCDDD